MLLEAVYHVPLSLWAVPALLRDDMLVPVHLLIWACETALTTLTCVVEAMSWEGFTGQEKVALAQLYVPYLLLGKDFWKSFLVWVGGWSANNLILRSNGHGR
jgi:EXPERA (EXPanded EBP superfamily)